MLKVALRALLMITADTYPDYQGFKLLCFLFLLIIIYTAGRLFLDAMKDSMIRQFFLDKLLAKKDKKRLLFIYVETASVINIIHLN